MIPAAIVQMPTDCNNSVSFEKEQLIENEKYEKILAQKM